MKHLSTTFKFILVTIMGLAVFSLVAPHVFADAKSAVCEGAGLAVGANGCATPAGTPDVDTTLQKGMNLFSAIVGIIAVVMIIVGGLKFIASQGDPTQMNNAKNTLIFAAVGLVIVALAQVIVHFVLQRFTK
jgi:hypothetical protein